MGQCLSAPNGPTQPEEPRGPATPPAGVYDRVVHPVARTHSGGLQVGVAQARFAATGAGGDPTQLLVRQSPLTTFIALFEGLGEDKHAVAAFCRIRAYEVFQDSCVRHSDPLEALKDTVQQLDEAVLHSDRLPNSVKARSGAACVLLLVEHGSQRVFCANVGAAQCLLSRITGSFNAKAPEGFFLTAEHTTRNKDEAVRLQRRAPGEPTPLVSSRGEPGQVLEATRALGFAAAKAHAGGTGMLSCEAHVVDHRLGTADQHLVLGTAAFWQLVGPADCALRAHFHEKFATQQLQRAEAAAAAQGAELEAPSPSLLHACNTAEHLLYWALEKAARQLGRLRHQQQGVGDGDFLNTRSQRLPSVADVMALPRQRQVLQAQSAGPQQQQQQLIRSDLHGDLGVLVVTLRRPDQSADQRLADIMVAARASAAAAAAAASGGQPHGSGVAGGYVQRLSRRRWDQIRMLVAFHKAHRRVVLKQWWGAQEALFRQARTAVGTAGRISVLHSPQQAPPPLGSLAAAAAAAGRRRSGHTATPPVALKPSPGPGSALGITAGAARSLTPLRGTPGTTTNTPGTGSRKPLSARSPPIGAAGAGGKAAPANQTAKSVSANDAAAKAAAAGAGPVAKAAGEIAEQGGSPSIQAAGLSGSFIGSGLANTNGPIALLACDANMTGSDSCN